MAAVAGAKTLGSPYTNDVELVRVTYDYAVDGGTAGALDLLTLTNAAVVRLKHCSVKTACTGASGTVSVGVTGAATAFVDATEGAVANLTANAIIDGASAPKYCAAGAKAILTIGTGLTAGKVECVFEVMRY